MAAVRTPRTRRGLPIARWIVQGHGGEVRLESTLGEGTLITNVDLPIDNA